MSRDSPRTSPTRVRASGSPAAVLPVREVVGGSAPLTEAERLVVLLGTLERLGADVRRRADALALVA